MHVLNTYFLQRNYIAELNKIVAALIEYNQFPHPENLHRIRVAIKKIKAIYALSTFISHQAEGDPTLNQLFKNAGALRELHIQIQFLKTISKNEQSCGIAIFKKLELRKNLFSQTIQMYICKLHQLRKEWAFPIKTIDHKLLEAYFTTQHHKIRKLFKAHKKKDMHQLRKTIKKTMYLYAFLPLEVQQKIPMNLNNMTNIQSALGDWHDWYVAKHFYSKKSTTSISTICFLSIKKQEKIACKKLKQKIAAMEII
jgi:CHAD domain-containing protein